MEILNKFFKFITDSKYRFNILASRGFFNNWSDEKFLKKKFKLIFGRELDLQNPQTFNEKMQWLKLYDRKPIYTTMVDKYEVKKYVADIIGEEYIIPTFGVWDRFEDIDFDKLPNQFVLKCTHDSGGLVICRDKAKFNYKAAKRKINKSLKRNYFWQGREWPYKNVKPRIIAEKYMEDKQSPELIDYKFYCFNGEPRFLYVSVGLEEHSTARISFVTFDWQFAPFYREDFQPFDTLPARPKNFNKMMEIAKKLSKGHTFLRVDLYEIEQQVYFSELTFHPSSGFMPFYPPEWNKKIGDWLILPNKNKYLC